MRWPFVFRATYEAQAAWRQAAEVRAAYAEELYANRVQAYDALLEKYHALRVSGANPHEPYAAVVESPMAQLGPLTRAALAEMANGQSGVVVRAMRNKAVALWLEMREDTNRDLKVAEAVYCGEAVNLS